MVRVLLQLEPYIDLASADAVLVAVELPSGRLLNSVRRCECFRCSVCRSPQQTQTLPSLLYKPPFQ